MKTLTVEQNSITYLDGNGKTHYYPASYIAYSRADKDKVGAYEIYIESIRQGHLLPKFIIFKEDDITNITLNGVVQSSVATFIDTFNSLTGEGLGGVVGYAETVTIVAGGNKTFASLTRVIGSSGAVKYQIDDNGASPIQLDMTVTMQSRAPGMTWMTMTYSDDSIVTKVLAQTEQITFDLVDIVPGTEVRPLFVTNTTGDLDVGVTG